MSVLPLCRLSLVFAAEVPLAVILRRGPSRFVELIKWNTKDDTFENGQWFHGHIYGERCGLSPDGRLFVYFAMSHRKVDEKNGYKQTYTAVSKPPYLTALAMWPEGSTWGGGGRFLDNKTLCLAYGKYRTFHPGVGDTEIYMAPLPDCHPSHPPRGLVIMTNLNYYAPDRNFKFTDRKYEGAEWFGVDHQQKEIFIRDGKLCRLINGCQEVLLRDFNLDKFINIKAPKWAAEW
jgi:hypothetical protein